MSFDGETRSVCLCCESHGFIADSDCPDYDLLRCSVCGYELYSCNEIIDANHYEESDQYVHYHDKTPRLLWHHDRAIKQLLALNLDCDSRILDFGCYDGFLVHQLRKLGFDAYGVDWNKDAIATGIKSYHLDGWLATGIDGKFSVVLAMEVIEHFQVPENFFRALEGYVEPGGFIILSCPSSKSIYRPLADYPPHHFSRFTPECLGLLVERHGYRVVEHEEQMSVSQLVRNWFGDRLRIFGRASNKESSMNLPMTDFFLASRKAFNRISDGLDWSLIPFNYILRKLGVRYIGQIVIARKVVE